MLIFSTPKAILELSGANVCQRKVGSSEKSLKWGKEKPIPNSLKIKHPADVVIVRTNKGCLRAPYLMMSLDWKSKVQTWIIKQREAIRWWSHISETLFDSQLGCKMLLHSWWTALPASDAQTHRRSSAQSWECGKMEQVACLRYHSGTQTTVDQAWNQSKEVSLPARIKTARGSHQSERPTNQWFTNCKMQRTCLQSSSTLGRLGGTMA